MIYLSDDDCLLGEPRRRHDRARWKPTPASPSSSRPGCCTTWSAQQEQGQFYDVPQDLRIERDRMRELLDHLLRHHIFPEIHIARRDALQRLMPRINEHRLLRLRARRRLPEPGRGADPEGAVLRLDHPLLRRRGAHARSATSEVEVAWDRYRGGLEYILARAGSQIARRGALGLHLRIQKMIAVRMSVAIRLRHAEEAQPARHLLHSRCG